MISETIAHYQITGAIGAGGMGDVHCASDIKLDREVALQVLPEVPRELSLVHLIERRFNL